MAKKKKITRKMINDIIIEHGYEDEEILLADGLEEAFIGLSAMQPSRQMCAVYDYDKCIAVLEKDMSYDEAVEYFEFNTVGAWVGEHTPIFVNTGMML